jgi:hypothetical protein
MTVPVLQSNCSGLLGILYQSYIPKIINAGIEIHLFEELSRKDMSLSELSQQLHSKEHITEAVLDVFIAVNLVQKHKETYSLTQVAKDFLLHDSAANQIGAVAMYSGSAGPFDKLAEVILHGAPDFNNRMWSSREAVLGMEQQNKGGTLQAVLSFVKAIPEFKNSEKMCDFAGSIGYYSYAFMQENSTLRSHVYDLPEVCVLAREIKEQDEHYSRITYHEFDISSDDSFGEGYDFFFSSHFLYDFNYRNRLTDFFKRVNRSIKRGGLFVSNHIAPMEKNGKHLVLSIVELMTRIVGYPTHQLSEKDLKTALKSAGFSQFRTEVVENVTPYPFLLLSAVKIEER